MQEADAAAPDQLVSRLLPLGQGASDTWHLLHDQKHTEIFSGGSAGPGKTFNGCLFEITEAIRLPGTAGAIFRKTAEDLRKSTQITFFECCDKNLLRPGIDYIFKSTKGEVHWAGGSVTYLDYLNFEPSDPNYSRLGGRQYTRAFVDEADQVEERAVEVLSSRLRYKLTEFCHSCAALEMAKRSEAIDCDDNGLPNLWKCYRCGIATKGLLPKLLLTGNPGDYWTKRRFVLDERDEPVKLKPHQARVFMLLDDNPDKAHVATYRTQLERLSDDYERQRLLFGDWLITPKTGREFFHAFETQKHARISVPYNPDTALHFSLDFNTAPYITGLAAQIWWEEIMERWRVHFLKEYCLRHPLARTEALCQAFVRDMQAGGSFPGHSKGVFYYGDATGKNASTMEREGVRHNFDIVERELRGHGLHSNSDRVLHKNPAHTVVRDYGNSYLRGEQRVWVTFEPTMTHTIRDMIMVKEAADGSILKVKVKDPTTHVRYEPYGHCLQTHYYLVVGAFPDDFATFASR